MNIPTLAPDFNGQPLTMSSREIAELLEKRHDDVKRSIKRLVDRGIIAQPPMADVQETGGNNRVYTTAEYHLSKRDTYVVVAQLSPEFTARVVDRWQELENQQTTPMSEDQMIANSMQILIERTQQQAAQIEDMREDVAAFERISASEGSVGFRVAAKTLKVTERKFRSWLYERRWCFKQGRAWQGYADKVRAGYVENFAEPYTCPRTGEDKIDVKMAFTAKGMARLAHLLQRGEEA